MDDRQVRAALERHWAAADANDFDAEHQIYRDDAVLEYPQSGERVRGRANIRASRVVQPSSKRFKVANNQCRRPLVHGTPHYLRRPAVVFREHHGTQGREGSP